MTLGWDDLRVLMTLGRAGSLSGAARMLGQNHSTVFRRVNAIESRTGVRFFERLKEGYRLTEAGEAALRCAERIEGDVHALGREILGRDMRLQGKVRLTAPEGIAGTMGPWLMAEFRRLHPDVTVEFLGAHSALDLARREADVAIRATLKPPDTSLGRRVCSFRFCAYASPDYLRESASVPLAEHDWCMIEGFVHWLVPAVWKKMQHGEERCVFTSPMTSSTVEAVRAGMGISVLPCYLGDADPLLVRVTEPFEWLTLELWLLTHPDLRHTARVKALMAFLHEALTAKAALFRGDEARPGHTPTLRVPA